MTSSSNCQSVLVVGVIFLIACGSLAYISYFSREDHEDLIVARIKESITEIRSNKNSDEAKTSSESETYFSTGKERKDKYFMDNILSFLFF